MSSLLPYAPHTKEQAFKPGPGSYAGDKIKTMRQDPGWKLGTETRNDRNFDKRKSF